MDGHRSSAVAPRLSDDAERPGELAGGCLFRPDARRYLVGAARAPDPQRPARCAGRAAPLFDLADGRTDPMVGAPLRAGRRLRSTARPIAAAMAEERRRGWPWQSRWACGRPGRTATGRALAVIPMTDAEWQRAIGGERVDALLRELRAAAESDPERLSSVDFMVLGIYATCAAACRGGQSLSSPRSARSSSMAPSSCCPNGPRAKSTATPSEPPYSGANSRARPPAILHREAHCGARAVTYRGWKRTAADHRPLGAC